MATIYKAEIVSYWKKYPKEYIEKILNDATKKHIGSESNEIRIKVI